MDKINEKTQSKIAKNALHHMIELCVSAAQNDFPRRTKTGRCPNSESPYQFSLRNSLFVRELAIFRSRYTTNKTFFIEIFCKIH